MKARIVALTFPVERTAPKPRTRGLAAWIWRYYDRHTRGHVPYHGRVFELNARLTVPVLLGGAVAVFGSLVLAATVTPMFLLGLLVWAPALAWNFIADRTRDRYLSWLDHPASRTSDALAPATAAKIRARYPDVPVYDTFEQMVAAHPIGVPEQYIPAVEPAQDAS